MQTSIVCDMWYVICDMCLGSIRLRLAMLCIAVSPGWAKEVFTMYTLFFSSSSCQQLWMPIILVNTSMPKFSILKEECFQYRYTSATILPVYKEVLFHVWRVAVFLLCRAAIWLCIFRNGYCSPDPSNGRARVSVTQLITLCTVWLQIYYTICYHIGRTFSYFWPARRR